MRFVIVLEEVLKFSLVEDDNGIIDDGDLVVVGDFKGDFGRERFETFTIKLPRRAAFKGGGGGNGFSNVENFCAAFVTRVGEASDDAFIFLNSSRWSLMESILRYSCSMRWMRVSARPTLLRLVW